MPNSGPPTPRRGFQLLLILGVAGIALFQALTSLSPADREVIDTDGYMRAVRVHELLAGEVGWFESFAPRSNAPFGHSMHWTRPLDALVAGIATPLSVVMPMGDAIYWAALAQGLALMISLALSMEWGARPLVGVRLSFLAGLGVIIQPSLLSYTSVGRLDHHGLLFLTFALLVGAVVRAWRHDSRQSALTAGLVAGVGLWISTEFLLPVALVLLYGGLLWVTGGPGRADAAYRFSISFLATVAAALVVERGRDLASVSYDRVSVVHLLVATVATLMWWPLLRWGRGLDSPMQRLVALAGAGAAALVVIGLAFPRFFGGPFVDVPLELREAWLSRVAELLPLWPIGPGVATGVYVMGAPVGAAVIGVVILGRRENRRLGTGWPFLLGALGVMVVLGFLQLRFSSYAQMLATIPWAWLAGFLLARLPRRSVMSSLGRVGAMGLAVAGFLLPTFIASALETFPTLSEEEQAARRCSVRRLAEEVASHGAASGDPSPVVLANVDFGPELLYRSPARVVAAPYHRNVDGILDVRRAFLGSPDAAFTEVLEPRGVDLIVICEGRDRADLGRAAEDPATLYATLLSRDLPPWAEEVPLSGEEVSGLHLYAVTS